MTTGLTVHPAAVGVGGILVCWKLRGRKKETIEFGDGWWGAGERPHLLSEDTSVRPFRIEVSEADIKDLYDRLDNTRYFSPLEDSKFHYGFNADHLRKVVSYWRNQFDWNKQVKVLNRCPHYKTTIEGFTASAAARIFYKLMLRLGHGEFYLQAGDWGSRISTLLSQMKPDSVKGLHLNLVLPQVGPGRLVSLLIGRYVPWLVGLNKDVMLIYPYLEKNVYAVLLESGYLHIQATKPDTVGSALNDSPAGLAAYILEKLSTWTNNTFRDLEEGGLTKKYTLDDLLTNVMIYWLTGSITSSMRFYKENFPRNYNRTPDTKLACTFLWAWLSSHASWCMNHVSGQKRSSGTSSHTHTCHAVDTLQR